jgi:hypothetical protein
MARGGRPSLCEPRRLLRQYGRQHRKAEVISYRDRARDETPITPARCESWGRTRCSLFGVQTDEPRWMLDPGCRLRARRIVLCVRPTTRSALMRSGGRGPCAVSTASSPALHLRTRGPQVGNVSGGCPVPRRFPPLRAPRPSPGEPLLSRASLPARALLRHSRRPPRCGRDARWPG